MILRSGRNPNRCNLYFYFVEHQHFTICYFFYYPYCRDKIYPFYREIPVIPNRWYKSAFRLVKGGEGEDKSKLKNEIKKSVENSKDKLSFHDVISIVEEVYRKK